MTPSSGGTTASGCIAPQGGDQGISTHQIKVAAIVINLSGATANNLVGVPPVSEQEANFNAVADALNAGGGVACRQAALSFYEANPLDSSSLQQVCLNIVQTQVFAVIDVGAYFLFPELASCYPQNNLPFFTISLLPAALQHQYYPYMFGSGLIEAVDRNLIFGLKQSGFFSATNGFAKLGVIYRSCDPQLEGTMTAALGRAGVTSSQVVFHDVGCPTAYDSPNDLEQAILQFQSFGATHLIEVEDDLDFANFTKIAEQQRFRPKYGLSGIASVAQTYGNSPPDFSNIANAVGIMPTRQGEERTPGLSPTAGTAQCDKIYASHGLGPVWTRPDIGISGYTCDELWLLKTAVQHAPVLHRDALASGLQSAKTIDFSYPLGPADFTAPGTTYGSQFWRTIQFFTSCNCWRVVDPAFHAGVA